VQTNQDNSSESQLIERLACQLNSLVLDVGADKIGMTMILGSLNVETGQMSICCLGHQQPIWFGTHPSSSSETGISSAVVSSLAHAKGQNRTLPSNAFLGDPKFPIPIVKTFFMGPGEGLLLFTDGLLENYPSRLKKRSLHAIGRKTQAAQEMVDGVTAVYERAAEDQGAAGDDVAMLAIQWLGKSDAA
jgi:hypothetical protein